MMFIRNVDLSYNLCTYTTISRSSKNMHIHIDLYLFFYKAATNYLSDEITVKACMHQPGTHAVKQQQQLYDQVRSRLRLQRRQGRRLLIPANLQKGN